GQPNGPRAHPRLRGRAGDRGEGVTVHRSHPSQGQLAGLDDTLVSKVYLGSHSREEVMAPSTAANSAFMSKDQLLAQWQGHRGLSRRVIEAFPEDHLFSFSVGGMRPFGELAGEMLRMAAPTAEGAATGKWVEYAQPAP